MLSTAVTTNKDHTLYAHWQKNKVVGDVNTDGSFSVTDIIMLQKWLLNAGEINDASAGDLYEDGVLNAYDAAVMKRMLTQQ